MRKFNRHNTAIDSDVPEIVKLWICRVLINLGAHQKFINEGRLDDEVIGFAIGLGDWVDVDDSGKSFRVKCLNELKSIHSSIERNAHKIGLPTGITANIVQLSNLVGLNRVEGEILGFAVFLKTSGALESVTAYLGNVTTVKMCRHLSEILQIRECDIQNALSTQGILHRSGLLTIDRQCQSMDYKIDLLSKGFADTPLCQNSCPITIS